MGGARGTDRNGDAPGVEHQDRGFAVGLGYPQVDVTRQAQIGMPIDGGIRQAVPQTTQQRFVQPPQAVDPAGQLIHRQLRRPAETHDRRDVLMSAAPAVFLNASFHLGTQPGAGLHVEGSGAWRAVQGPGGKGQGVDVQLVNVDGQAPHGSHGIGVNDRTVPVGDLGDFAHRLDRAGLIVGAHDGNEYGIVPHGPRDLVGLHYAVPAGRDLRECKPLALQRLRGIQHGVMLDT